MTKMTHITIKKVAQGRYTAWKNGEKVGTATFTRKYRPLPNLPVGYQVTISVKGKPTLKKIVRTITEGRAKLLRAV